MTTGRHWSRGLGNHSGKTTRWTTCAWRSAARLNTTLPGGLEMVSLFAAQVETTIRTPFVSYLQTMADQSCKFLDEVPQPFRGRRTCSASHFARSSLQNDMRSMYDGLEKVADLSLKGTNLGWVPEPHPMSHSNSKSQVYSLISSQVSS